MSVPSLVCLLSAVGGGGRSPYWRVEEKVSQRIWLCSSSCSMNGAHLGNELVSAVAPMSATPGLLALVSGIGAVVPVSEVKKIVAVRSVSASHDASAG